MNFHYSYSAKSALTSKLLEHWPAINYVLNWTSTNVQARHRGGWLGANAMGDFSGRFCPRARQRHLPPVEPARKTEPPLVILVDTREQLPLTPYFSVDVQTEVCTLETGDYSAKGVSEVVRCERKAIGDFISCVTVSRERFLEQMQRLAAYPVKALVIEATWHELSAGLYRSKVSPLSVTGTLLAVITDYGIPVILAETPQGAAEVVERMLRRVVRKAGQERAA